DVLEASPGRVVRGPEVGQLPVLVLVVPERERCRRVDRKNELSRLPLCRAWLAFACDIPRCRDHGIAGGGGGDENLQQGGRDRERQQDERSAHGTSSISGPASQ